MSIDDILGTYNHNDHNYNPPINLRALTGQNASRGTKSDDGCQTIYPVRFDIRRPIL